MKIQIKVYYGGEYITIGTYPQIPVPAKDDVIVIWDDPKKTTEDDRILSFKISSARHDLANGHIILDATQVF